MKESPILFSAPMLKAILEGRKTQTRRILRMTDRARADIGDRWPVEAAPGYFRWEGLDGEPPFDAKNYNAWCPYGQPGDRLWIREPLRRLYHWGKNNGWATYTDGNYVRRWAEDKVQYRDYPWRWQRETLSPIHMPRDAARYLLEVTGVRVERLRDISEEDARQEGVDPNEWTLRYAESVPESDRHQIPERARYGFQILWDSINGKRAPWVSNPFVWVVSFRRVEAARGASAA